MFLENIEHAIPSKQAITKIVFIGNTTISFDKQYKMIQVSHNGQTVRDYYTSLSSFAIECDMHSSVLEATGMLFNKTIKENASHIHVTFQYV
jgi:hypothetical protein